MIIKENRALGRFKKKKERNLCPTLSEHIYTPNNTWYLYRIIIQFDKISRKP